MNQIEAKILGQSYLLGCPDGGEERMLEAVHRVDSAMCAIRDAGRIKARERIAVLAALNIAFEQSEPVAPVPVPAAAAPADEQLAAILARLDAELGDDGRLL
jgi:cell division protein ZapA